MSEKTITRYDLVTESRDTDSVPGGLRYVEVMRPKDNGKYLVSDHEAALRAENERLREALRDLLTYAERQQCTHEDTERRGFNWTFCMACGKKWADDEGGFKPYEEPVEITASRNALTETEAK